MTWTHHALSQLDVYALVAAYALAYAVWTRLLARLWRHR